MHTAVRCIAGLAAVAAVLALAILTLPSRPKHAALEVVTFADLGGWTDGAFLASAQAFARSCEQLMRRDADAAMGGEAAFGTAADWQPVCADFLSLGLAAIDDITLRTFFETRFTPVAVMGDDGPDGLFTGYFEPEYEGRLEKDDTHQEPLYARPAELIMVDLGQFRDEWQGRRIGGRVSGGELLPFHTRADIDQGALGDEARVIAWLKSPVDAFFLHIQGSGVVLLEDGTRYRVGYAAQNGRDYTAIGRVLRDMGALSPEGISMQSIRQWLEDHPEDADAVMHANESFVFFRPVDGEGPIGAAGLPLTAGHSLAVDRAFLPLGIPLWLETEAPLQGETLSPLRRLMIAQDTGGAITGAVRGDVFWGTGAEAGEVAGRMASQGRYYALLPNALAETLR